MSEARLWRAESVDRLRAALDAGTHEARAAFGEWYRVRAWNSIATRVIARPLAFESPEAIEACFADLEGRWLARHEHLCAEAALDPALRGVLARSAIGRAFDAARRAMGIAEGVTAADLGTLG